MSEFVSGEWIVFVPKSMDDLKEPYQWTIGEEATWVDSESGELDAHRLAWTHYTFRRFHQSTITTWAELSAAVHKWSLANFGSQKGLGCLAPLLGMAEEAGEFLEANTSEGREDAQGDVLIFLMDYCARSGVDLSGIPLQPENDEIWFLLRPENNEIWFLQAVLRLCHTRLKRVQGIRGMDDHEAFRKQELEIVTSIIASIPGAFNTANKVWSDVVSKRKWHTQPDKPINLVSCVRDFSKLAAELNHGVV